jgi:O-antigen ligase
VLPLVISYNLIDLSIKKRFLTILCSFLTSLSIIFTNTRGAWLGAVGGVIFLSIFKNKKLIFGIIVLVLLSSVFVPSFLQRASTIPDFNNDSNYERLLMWQSAFNMFKDYPILGAGLGMFSELYPTQYVLPEAEVKHRRYAHNIIMNMIAEIGIIGLGAFLFLIYSMFKLGINLAKKLDDEYWSYIIFSLLAGIFSFLIQGLTFYNIGVSHTGKAFWLISALLMVVRREKLINNKTLEV